MATDKTQGLPHVAAATAAEIAAAAIAPFVQKRLASLLRSRDACEAELKIVSVFDHAVGEFAPCMCANSEAAAIRIFTNEVNRYDPNNLLSTNKTDFTLYVVGLIS